MLFFEGYGDHRDLHVLTHSFPTRRSSDLDCTDTVLSWDARLPRTLWPLLARPAFLTREYFAGRRVRYVSPVRLFVTLAIVTFFVAQLMISFGGNEIGRAHV